MSLICWSSSQCCCPLWLGPNLWARALMVAIKSNPLKNHQQWTYNQCPKLKQKSFFRKKIYLSRTKKHATTFIINKQKVGFSTLKNWYKKTFSLLHTFYHSHILFDVKLWFICKILQLFHISTQSKKRLIDIMKKRRG